MNLLTFLRLNEAIFFPKIHNPPAQARAGRSDCSFPCRPAWAQGYMDGSRLWLNIAKVLESVFMVISACQDTLVCPLDALTIAEFSLNGPDQQEMIIQFTPALK